MVRLFSIGLAALLLLSTGGCASEPGSGTASQPTPRTDRLDPVNAFPQVRDSYMRQ